MTSIRRIQKELAELARNPLPNVSVGPSSGDDLTHWEGVVTGPVESPFSNGLFKITIDFPADYPFKPPKINFLHKNIPPKY
ncbi:hypothetical protein BASA61_001712 [Batrachochytrium salamandrivorans]|nr:hypothetical protein BASA61_001712 [Batrachochytrium salamandrivorans]